MNAYESIEKTLNYIEGHLSNKITTEKLARIACLSTFYYQRLFKRLVNKPVQEYIKLRRLARAMNELKHSDKRILDIAIECGFFDHANFTRAFKEVYHVTPNEYRKSSVMLNTYDKPALSSQYILIDENVPLIVDDIVLEITRKSLDKNEIYHGFESDVPIDQQIPLGESTGIDIPGQLWKEYHDIRNENNIEIGVSSSANLEKGTFRYFVGGKMASADICPEGMVKYTLLVGEYIICKIEAESFEKLVTTALNLASRYLFETWLPKHKLVTEPFMVEKYNGDIHGGYSMELWLRLIEKR